MPANACLINFVSASRLLGVQAIESTRALTTKFFAQFTMCLQDIYLYTYFRRFGCCPRVDRTGVLRCGREAPRPDVHECVLGHLIRLLPCRLHAQPINTCLLVLYRIYFLSLTLHAYAISARQHRQAVAMLCPCSSLRLCSIHQCRRSGRSTHTDVRTHFFAIAMSACVCAVVFSRFRTSD